MNLIAALAVPKLVIAADRHQPDHEAVAAEVVRPQAPRDQDRGQHPEQELGVDADRGVHRVAQHLRFGGHSVANKIFTST
jgi:hypothetical protein